MRNFVLLTMCLLAGFFLPALAQSTVSTDVSSTASVLYSQEMSVKPGNQLVLPVFMKNESDVTLFQTDVYAPEGFTFAKKTNGRYAVSLDRTRLTDEDDDHSITTSIQPDGAMRILCSSANNFTFDGNDGRVMTITFDVAEDAVPGKYAVKLNKQKLVRPNNQGYTIPEYQVEVTVESSERYDSRYDVNQDGHVTIEDVTDIVNFILGK